MYRRYYEWIFSLYDQKHKLTATSFEDIGTYLTTKPIISPFHSGEVFDSYNTVFEDVAILNYHNGKSIMESFFCEGMINADRICQYVKETPRERANENNGAKVEGRRIVQSAVEKNIIASNSDATKFVDQVTEHVEKEFN